MTSFASLDNAKQVSRALCNASALLDGYNSWTIFTHQKVDGDALGSATALFGAGVESGKRVTWLGVDQKLPDSYSFLEHTGDYRYHDGIFTFDDPNELYIFLDCSNSRRSIQSELPAHGRDIKILNIDHHQDNTFFGTVNCVDSNSSSTSEVVFNILTTGGWLITKKIAESLYVGICTDTGGFAFSNTTSRTHRFVAELIDFGVDPAPIDDKLHQTRTLASMALWGRALEHTRVFGPQTNFGGIFAISWLSRDDFKITGTRDSDTEGLSSTIMKLRGVRLVVLLIENEPPNNTVRASFRSREGVFPASDIAHQFGGGGHPRAAGATLPGSLAERLIDIPECLERRYKEWLLECQSQIQE